MNAKIFYLVLCLSPLVFGEQIEEVRKEALEKLKGDLSLIEKTNEQIKAYVEPSLENYDELYKSRKNHGNGILERSSFEIYHISNVFQMKRTFYKLGRNVTECIEDMKTEMQNTLVDKTTELFENPMSKSNEKNRKTLKDTISKWNLVYSAKLQDWRDKYQRLVTDIPTWTSENKITTEVLNFKKITSETINFGLDIIQQLNTIKLAALKEYKGFIEALKLFTRKFIDINFYNFNTCFFSFKYLDKFPIVNIH